MTIGKFGIVTPKAARKKALKLLGEMAEGKNPNAERKAQRASEITVREAFDENDLQGGNDLPGLLQSNVVQKRILVKILR